MSLLEWGALGELIGGAAIIISLIYVGIQIRQNTTAQRLSTSHQISEDLADVYLFPSGSEDMAQIFIDGLTGDVSLQGPDHMRFYGYLHKFFRTMENAYYQYRHGALEWHAFEGVTRQFQYIVSTPGGQRYWAERGHWYNDEFKAYVDDLIATNDQDTIRLGGD
jgi:hypothetical protein